LSKRTFDLEINPWDEVLDEEERRTVNESPDKCGGCGCYVRSVDFAIYLDHQRKGLDRGRLLLKWFIQAAEQEMMPLFTTTSSNSSSLARLCMEMGAEEAGTFAGRDPYLTWMGDATDSDAPQLEEDGIEGFKFMMWKASEESVHHKKD
jgi:hypothetical protein